MNHSLKVLMTVLGCLCVALGIAGIFLPLLPTTPLLLLASWFFARSSDRFHRWLINHPSLGAIILAWENGEGLERKVRRRVLIVLWFGMFVSMIVLNRLWASLLLCLIGIGVTVYILRQPVKD